MNLNQPDLGQEVIDRLSRDYGSLASAVAEHRKAASALPDGVTDKTSHDAFVDLIAKIKASAKHAEGIRVAEKDPFMRQERAVDGFFTPVIGALEKLQKTLTAGVKAYLDHVAYTERLAREKAAAAARAEAERLRRDQEAAERRAAAADQERRREAAALNRATADRAAFEAAQQESLARVQDVAAQASPAEMARTRSDQGTLSTLKAEWTHEVLDYGEIPLDVLRAYISREAIDRALKQAIRMGVREIPGVRIFEATKAMIR